VNGYAEVIGGNYNERKVDGAINLPVNDMLAARVAFNIENRGSFFEDIGQNLGDASARVTTNPGSIDEKNFRVGLLFEPTDHFQALFKGEINELSTGGLTPRPLPPCSICAADSSFYQYGYNGPSIYNGFQNLNVYQLDYNTTVVSTMPAATSGPSTSTTMSSVGKGSSSADISARSSAAITCNTAACNSRF
jgi:hypothetical protein